MESSEGTVSPSPEKVSSMTVGPISGQTPISAGPAQLHTRVARWAVGLAEAAAVLISIAFVVFGVAYLVGGSSATEDNWVGFLTVASLFGALLTSVSAFVLAVAVKVRHERWTLLWLPLSVFPALLAFLVLGEAFWWE
jgi:hypothetical protein